MLARELAALLMQRPEIEVLSLEEKEPIAAPIVAVSISGFNVNQDLEVVNTGKREIITDSLYDLKLRLENAKRAVESSKEEYERMRDMWTQEELEKSGHSTFEEYSRGVQMYLIHARETLYRYISLSSRLVLLLG